MADITDANDQTSPTDLEESHVGNGTAGESRGVKRARPSTADDDDDDDDKNSRERRKIEIKFINDKSRRHITFSKRKAGIMKKVCAYSCRDRKPPRLLACRHLCTFHALQRDALQKL
jgi:pheromone receptor transcription factor